MTTVTAYVKKLFKKLSRFCLNYSEERGIPTGSGPYRVGMVDVLTEQLCGVNGRIFYPIEPAEDDPSRYVQWFSRAEYAYGFAGIPFIIPQNVLQLIFDSICSRDRHCNWCQVKIPKGKIPQVKIPVCQNARTLKLPQCQNTTI